jgi:predicted nuclease with TOPRIM domain
MKDTESEMLNTTFSGMKQFITAMVNRLEALEKQDTINANTIHNLPQILENLSDRMQRLEDRFEKIETASDERIEQICERMIESALEDYDPADHIDFQDQFNDEIVGTSMFEEAVREACRELQFSVEVR